MPRVLLLTAPSSYRTAAFLKAARRLSLEIVQLSDMPTALNDHYHVNSTVDFADIDLAVEQILKMNAEQPFSAIISVDDAATQLAAVASERLGLPANNPAASLAARDKFVMRQALRNQGLKTPDFTTHPVDLDPLTIASSIDYPCVVKPRQLSGSRGVIRANDPEEFIAAFRRAAAIVRGGESTPEQPTILVEDYLDGDEVAVEGILTDGELHVLAIFDKPDPLEGPFFEETIYVTPSRHPPAVQRLIADEVAAAAEAVGLMHGPVHAELRINSSGAWMLEVAGRSIGGL